MMKSIKTSYFLYLNYLNERYLKDPWLKYKRHVSTDAHNDAYFIHFSQFKILKFASDLSSFQILNRVLDQDFIKRCFVSM